LTLTTPNSTLLLSRLQLRTSAARRAARTGRGQRQHRRSPARVEVVARSVWSILDRQQFSCLISMHTSLSLLLGVHSLPLSL